VGTVAGVEIITDSTVQVTMLINRDAAKFIKKDALASIGSEGLMGDRIVTIASGSVDARPIDDGDQIRTVEPIEIETVMGMLTETGADAQRLVRNLAQLSQMIEQGEGTLGYLITDTTLPYRLDRMMTSLNRTTANAARLTDDFTTISDRLQRGEGTAGRLLMQDSLADRMVYLLDTLQVTASKSQQITSNLVEFSERLNNEAGPVNRLLTDTTLAETLEVTLQNVNRGAEGISQTTDRLNSSWFFRFLFGGNRRNRNAEADANR
jgi:phospholipid/cholesterol/gamma-HCH transport system substrate-binding protein